ncbi:hypothetical protein HDU87_000482 [Geranomyces variabilis]|uniref:Nudix hydrolase domain-containing protein n=1 Tax=Geranomyces variabilis TaxID=109894 RepID=A0AAD5TEP4_9FUNG|nr:hypothetical protein HDU87_000482 [Geranomyces variabilis]
MGYVDFVRGRWPDHNPELQNRVLKTYLEEMTCEERARLRSMDFESLWDLVWTDHLSRIYISEGQEARNRYEKLDIAHLLATTTCCYTEPEYGFPKGRKNMYESNLDCAKREFQEETGYRSEQYRILSDVPWVESFVGTNGIPYRHIYYAAEVTAEFPPTFTEVLREDTDQDGYVTRAEIEVAMAVDLNADGIVSADEKTIAGQEWFNSFFAAQDSNSDSKISLPELLEYNNKK